MIENGNIKSIILDSIGDIITYHDINYKIVWINKPATYFSASLPENLIDCKCYEVWLNISKPCVDCPLKNSSKKIRPRIVETTSPNRINWLMKCYPIYNDHKTLKGIVGTLTDITNIKDTEKKLQENERKYKDLFNHISSGVAVYESKNNGEDFIFKDLNKRGEKISRMKKDEVLNKSVLDLFPGVKASGLFNVFQEVWKTGKSMHHPITLYKDDRISHWMENFVYKLPSGEIVAVYDDITERMKAEEKLKESKKSLQLLNKELEQKVEERASELKKSEEKFRSIFNAIPDLFFMVDSEGIHLDFKGNKSLLYLIPDLFLGKSINEIPSEIVARSYMEAIKRTLETQKPTIIEYSLPVKNKIYYFEARILFFSEDRAAIFVRDISKRKRSEQEIIELKEFYKNILNGIINGVWVTNKNDVIFYANEGMEVIAGINADQIVGARVLIDFSKDTLKYFRPYYLKAKKSLKLLFYNAIPVVTPAGRQSYQSGWLIPRIKEGKYDGIICTVDDVTERKKAEEKLKEPEERLRAFMASSPDGFAILDTELNFLEINDSGLKLMGLTYEKVIGKDILEVSPTLKGTDRYNKYLEVIKTGKPLYMDDFIPDPKFGIIHLNVRMFKVGNGLGIITTDITERKSAEEKLKESEENFRDLYEGVPNAYYSIGKNKTILQCNKAAERLLGYNKEELLSMNVFDLYADTKNGLEKAQEVFRRFLKEENIQDEELLMKHKNGTHIWISLSVKPIKDLSGKIIESRSMVIDISKRKRAKQKLKESEEKFRSIAEYSVVGIKIIQDNLIKYINQQMLNFFDLTLEEINQWQPGEFLSVIHPDHRELVNIALLKNQSGEKNFRFHMELKGLKKNGETFWLDYYARSIIFQGRPASLNIIIDITEKKIAEELIMEENKKLLELHEMRKDIINRVSHELKTPLTSMYGTSQLLLDFYREDMSKKELEYVEIQHRGCIRLKELINNLLDASRIESKRLELKLYNENVVKIIKECVENMMPLATNRDLKVKLDLPNEFSLNIDKLRLEQAITNIISNAIKNTPSGGKIFISLIKRENYVDILVKDTGVGLTEKEKGKIFIKFGKIERYGMNLGVDIDGTGLGLFISKEIVELHGGKIWCESKGRNKGATFIIRFPINRQN